MALPVTERLRLIGVVGVLSFGLSALFAVVGFGTLSSIVFVLGFFVVIPLIALLGDDVPLVASGGDGEGSESRTAEQPIAELRDRYAAGEIDEAEFERRLDRLLETEPFDERIEDETKTRAAGRSGSRRSERRERELE